MSGLSYQSEPQIQFLHQLVRDIAAGNLQLPRFMRPYVWTEEQQLELFRSVQMGTPIGSITLWRTHILDIKCYDSLGPYTLKPPSGPMRTYILDGHQRLATLFGALYVPEEGSPGPEPIACYDLKEEDFFLASSWELRDPRMLPLQFVLNFAKLLPLQRSLTAEGGSDVLLRRLDAVVTAFGQYKVPVVTIVTNDLGQVTRTFQRLNSQGTPLSEVHMISALTWSQDFDLAEEMARRKEQHLAPLGWGDVEDDVLFRACKPALGFPLDDRHFDAISQELRKASSALDEVTQALVRVIGFLRESCGIQSPKVLPYLSHLVPLIEAVRRNPSRVEGEQRTVFLKWFWTLAYTTRRFSLGGSLDLLGYLAGEGAPPPSPPAFRAGLESLPKSFDFRRSRCRTMALRLAELGGGDAAEWLGLHGVDAVPHILWGGTAGRQDSFESPANRFVVHPNKAGEERERIRDACQKSARTEEDLSVLRRHAIPVDAANAFAVGDLPRFFSLRLAALEQLENDFAVRVGLLSP